MDFSEAGLRSNSPFRALTRPASAVQKALSPAQTVPIQSTLRYLQAQLDAIPSAEVPVREESHVQERYLAKNARLHIQSQQQRLHDLDKLVMMYASFVLNNMGMYTGMQIIIKPTGRVQECVCLSLKAHSNSCVQGIHVCWLCS